MTLAFTQWHQRYGASCLSRQGRTSVPLASVGIAFCVFLKSQTLCFSKSFSFLPSSIHSIWRCQHSSRLHSLIPLTYLAALTLRCLFHGCPSLSVIMVTAVPRLASLAFFITMDLPAVLGCTLFSCLVTLHCQQISPSRGIAHHFFSCSTKHGCLIAVIIKFKFHSVIFIVMIWNQPSVKC